LARLFLAGMIKSTYGTGCFALLNTGTTPVASNNKLLTTIAYQSEGPAHPTRSKARSSSRARRRKAARWASASFKHASEPGRSPTIRLHAERLSGAGLLSASARHTEIARPRRAVRATRNNRARRARALPRWRVSATRRLICGPRCAPTGPSQGGQHRGCRRWRHDRVRLDMQRLADPLDAPVDRR